MPQVGFDEPPQRRKVPRERLVPVAVMMVLGIIAGRYVHLPIGLWLTLGVVAIVVSMITFWREELYLLMICGVLSAIFFISSAWCSSAYYYVPGNHIVSFTSTGGVLCTLRGRLITPPRYQRSRTIYYTPAKTFFLLHPDAIKRTDGKWISTTGLVSVRVDEPVFDLSTADEVELIGTLRRPRPPSNPGQYDWASALRYKGILVKFYVPGADGVKVVSHRGGGVLSVLIARARQLVRQHLTSSVGVDEAPLLEAIVLGYRSPRLRELNRAMVEAGVAHFLSISGLHLGIFLGFIYLLCRLMLFSPRRAGWVVLGVLLGYVLLASPRPPLLRAAVVAGSIAIGLISARRISIMNALAVAAIVLLIFDPLSIFTVGFQMSFVIVLGIILLNNPIKQLLFGRWLKRRTLVVFRADQQIHKWLYRQGANWTMNLIVVAISAYLSALPLVAYYFGIFTPYAPILSIILLPLITLILIPAYLSSMLAFLLPNLSAIIASLAATPARVLQWFVSLLKKIPYLCIDLYSVPFWWVLLVYMAMGFWIITARYSRNHHGSTKRLWRRVSVISTAALIITTVITQLPSKPAGRADLHILDVSHGNMILLQSSDGETYLFDAGSLAPIDPYQQVLRPFLRAKHLPTPQAVFISHANVDHYNGVFGLLERNPPEKVFLNEYFGKRAEDSPMVKRLLNQIKGFHIKIIRLRAGDKLMLDKGVFIEVLWPPANREDLDVNNTSLVLRIHVGKQTVLIPGDITITAEEYLSKLPADKIHADVLILPHHGSFSTMLENFVRAVNPQILIQSSSYRPDKAEMLQITSTCRRYATYRTGWIDLSFKAEGMVIKTMRSR